MTNIHFAMSAQPLACPSCGEMGQSINTMTVKAWLAQSLRSIQDSDYRFCRQEACPVVYYTQGQQFTEADLREAVYHKQPANPAVMACYCFHHTVGAIIADIQIHGTTNVEEDIRAGIQADQCACDMRNPSGRCCLGTIVPLIKRLQTTVAQSAE